MSDTLQAKSTASESGGPNSSRQPDIWLKNQIMRGCREGLFTTTVELTPELAMLLLTNNPNNRNISHWKIEQYARDIKNGKWDHNGAAIIIAKDGEMNDGQHRCEAVLEAEKPITTQITFGAERQTRSTLDIGMKREVGQHLTMAGHSNTRLLAYAIASYLAIKNHGRLECPLSARPTTSEILDWAEEHPEMQESVLTASRLAKKIRVSPGLFGALHYLFSERAPRAANKFFEGLIDGTGLEKGNPMYALREQLVRNAASSAKLTPSETAARAIKAWNAYRRGRSLMALGRRRNGEGAESFPIPE